MTWGPWIEHDMLGIKPYGAGVYYQREYGFPSSEVVARDEGVSSSPAGRAYGWHSDDFYFPSRENRSYVVIRYRIRKPKGLTLLEEIAKNPERELEDV